MASALDMVAAAIGANQVDDCHVGVSLLGGAVTLLLRRDDAEAEPHGRGCGCPH